MGDSRLKPSEASFSIIFLTVNNIRPEVDSDVISAAVINLTGVKVRVKSSDSKSNRYRDIRLSHFTTNNHDDDNDAGVRRSSHKGKNVVAY